MTDLAALEQVPGLTPHAICRTLYDLAGEVPRDQAVVEIGVFKGRSACWLGAGAQDGQGAHVYAVDPWDLPGERGPYIPARKGKRVKHRVEFTHRDTRLEAKRNIHRVGLRNQVTLVRAFSVEYAVAWDGPPVGLLFVDGDHTEGGVFGDFDAWRPHLAEGAVVAFDDYRCAVELTRRCSISGSCTRSTGVSFIDGTRSSRPPM